MSIKVKSIKAAIWVANFSFARAILSFVVTLILSFFLTPEDFGVIAIVELVIINLELIRNLGIDQELIYRQKLVQKAADTAFFLMILSGLIFCLLTYFSAPAIGKFFNSASLAPILQAVAPIMLISGLGIVPAALLEKELKFKERFIVEGIAFVVYSLVTIILIYWKVGVWSVVYGKISQSLFQVALLWIVARWHPHSWGNSKVAFEMLDYGKYVTATAILAISFQYVDNAAIGKFAGTEALGLYVLAFSLANLPAKATSVLVNRISFPVYSQLQQDIQKLGSVFCKSIQMVTLFSIPISITILILAPRLILTLYSDKWIGSIEALQILSFYGLARSVGALSSSIFFVLGKKELVVKILFSVTALAVLLLYPVTVYFGIIGVSLLVTTIIVVSSLGMIHLALRYLGSNWHTLFNLVRSQIFGTFFMALVIWPLSHFLPLTLFYLIILLGLSAIVYLGSILLLTRGKIIAEGVKLIEEVGLSSHFSNLLLKKFTLARISAPKE